MNDEPYYEKKFRQFSVVKKCPRCGQLSLAFKGNEIHCENCGYAEKVPTAR